MLILTRRRPSPGVHAWAMYTCPNCRDWAPNRLAQCSCTEANEFAMRCGKWSMWTAEVTCYQCLGPPRQRPHLYPEPSGAHFPGPTEMRFPRGVAST